MWILAGILFIFSWFGPTINETIRNLSCAVVCGLFGALNEGIAPEVYGEDDVTVSFFTQEGAPVTRFVAGAWMLIVGEDGVNYIIDWAHATQGNASADAARTYLLFKLHKQDDLAEKYLRLFCMKTDTAIQYVQKVLPIVAASQSVKRKPEEAEFLAQWVNVCDWQ